MSLFRKIPKVDKIEQQLSNYPKKILTPIIRDTLQKIREDIKENKIKDISEEEIIFTIEKK